jgi:anaerobic ribonucleoside-triphosphate reductase activating protein
MLIELSRAHHPVTVLGPGRRIGLWMQGCSIGCSGCVAADTWAPDPDRALPVAELAGWCRSVAETGQVDGVTISGGEPFDQPEALLELLRDLRGWADAGARDLLCYSGRSLAALRARHGVILALLDAVIPGPYVEDQAPGLRWRGSANQELVPLTPLGRERYADHVAEPAGRTRLQVAVDGSALWFIGVPQPGDLAALPAALARRGLVGEQSSWPS